jgi:hypothetical protein
MSVNALLEGSAAGHVADLNHTGIAARPAVLERTLDAGLVDVRGGSPMRASVVLDALETTARPRFAA